MVARHCERCAVPCAKRRITLVLSHCSLVVLYDGNPVAMVVVAAMSVVVIAVVIAVRHGERPPHAGVHCRVTWIGGGRPPVQLDGFSRAF